MMRKIRLREAGGLFGQIEHIGLEDPDLSVKFIALLKPKMTVFFFFPQYPLLRIFFSPWFCL